MTSANTSFTDHRPTSHPDTSCRPCSFVQFGIGQPQFTEADGSPTWIARGANFVVAVSLVEENQQLVQQDIPDESMLLLSAATPVTVRVADASEAISDEALAILPPGSARVISRGRGLIVRIFSSAATRLCELASNASACGGPGNDVAPLEYWPAPVDGFRLRVYRLRDHSEEVGFGRIFRSTNLMVNLFEPASAPRDLSRLSPHEHADFEQGSLTMEGDFTHYLRTPWGPDSSLWRPDERLTCSGCSLLVIAPRTIHTTSWSNAGARLVDIFAPPRTDFSLQRGWVRNAEDYPLPARGSRG